MKLAFVCLNADASDPVHATTARWIDAFAARPEIDHLTVLALRAGPVPPRANLTVRTFRGQNRIGTLWNFYREVVRALRTGVGAIFVYQTGPYPVLLWPVKLLAGVPVYYWKAHPHISTWTRLGAKFVARKVFTSTPAAFPLALPNVVVVGQGVDVARFVPRPSVPLGDLVTVGRVAPVKGLEEMIRAVARCNERFGSRLRLDVYGPTLSEDGAHAQQLAELAGSFGRLAPVTFHGPVVQDELPVLLGGYRAFLNFSKTALDRSVVEAMACGVPVLSTNPAVAEILPPDLRGDLTAPADNLDAQAEAIHRLLDLDDQRRADISAALRRLVVEEHNLDALVARIIGELDHVRAE
jgi:glycosyltransferase involved in cell wall biosynthesis